jgi:hypothetical protein
MLFNVPWHIVVLLLGNCQGLHGAVGPRCHACFAGQMNYPHLPPLVLFPLVFDINGRHFGYNLPVTHDFGGLYAMLSCSLRAETSGILFERRVSKNATGRSARKTWRVCHSDGRSGCRARRCGRCSGLIGQRGCAG